ncbi:MAG: tetratricopeptide repeat protein [Chitinophagales bacterium]|nr:tetratricopeptide repeat protein [Chitinophagales bacterium]
MKINNHLIGFLLLALLMLQGNAFAKKKAKDKKENTSSIPAGNTVKSLTREALFINAMQSKLLGNYNEALLRFSAIVKEDPSNYEAHFQLAQVYYQLSLFDKAEAACMKAVSLNPNKEWFYIYLGQIQYEKGEVSKAVETYKKLVQLKPNDISLYMDYASLLIEDDKKKEALAVYDLLEKKFGVREDLALEKMLLYSDLKMFDKNIEEANKLLHLDSNEYRYYGYLGDAYEEKGQKEKAIEVYRRVLKMDVGNVQAYYSILKIYHQEKDDDKLEQVLLEIIHSKDIEVKDKLTLVLPIIQENIFGEVMLNEELTQKIIDELTVSHPSDHDVLLFVADIYHNVKKEDKATQIIQRGLADTSATEIDVVNYLSILIEMGNFELIAQEASLASKKFPDNAVFDYLKAISFFNLKNYKQTQSSYQEGLQKKNDNQNLRLQMLIGLADVSGELKDFDLADKSYDSALEIDPNNALALNNYAYYLSIRNIELDKAEKMSKKSNLLEKDNAAYQDTYAWIFYQKGDYKEALNWMKKSLNSAGDQPSYEMLHHMGDILLKLDETNQAVQYWEQSLKLNDQQDGLLEKIEKYKNK